ncbi:MAG: TolC family protein [Deltaproteobacteria bacterium]|nr:TolC family protein [Deltaproteobacteria bacterium]
MPESRRFLFLLLAFSLSNPASILAEEPQKDRITLSFKEGAVKVIENNLDILIEKVSPRIAEENIARQEGAFDIEAFGSFKRQDSETPLSARPSVAAGGLTSIKSEGYSLDAGLTGKTRIGTTYTLEARNDWTAETLNRFEFEYVSFTGVTITQPLLKNFGGNATELQINIARKDRDISINRLKGRVTDTLADYGFAYWDLIRVREELRVRRESQRLAEALFEINRKKFEAGSISAIEATQAEAAASTRKDDVIVSEGAVREKESVLKLLISKDVFALKDKEIVPEGNGAIRPQVEPVEESVNTAIKLRPDYLEAKTGLEKNNIRIKYAENQKFPKIDLEASYGYNGLGTSLGRSYNNLDSNPEWSLGLVLRYPLGNRTAMGDLRAARLEADQNVLRLKKIEQEIILNIDRAIKDIQAGTTRVEAAKVSTRLTEESLSAEEKKLAAGRSTTYNVLKVQEDLAKARLNEIAAISDYNKALIRYHRERGTLLDELGIRMKDTEVER